ncbi:Eukaryotic translation initiation factor 2A [Schistosoma japonicum]|nr:Eukaryotic translation initiation factor 2A [Schistosoma japonicum]
MEVLQPEKPCTKLSLKGIRHFSMSASIQPNLAVYIPGEKNQPSVVRVYQYRDNQLISATNKSFFRADTVRLLWNDKGTDLLILTSTKVILRKYCYYKYLIFTCFYYLVIYFTFFMRLFSLDL